MRPTSAAHFCSLVFSSIEAPSVLELSLTPANLKDVRQCRILCDCTLVVPCRQDLFEEDGVIQSVDRSIRILLATQGARRLSLSDLAAHSSYPAPPCGILRTLAAHGMVEREPGSLRYMLGPAVLRLNNVYSTASSSAAGLSGGPRS